MTATLVNNLKREAKRMKKAGGCTHSEALDVLAKKHGYHNWASLMHEEAKLAKRLDTESMATRGDIE